MEINILELRKRATINPFLQYKWMSKLTNEEITSWNLAEENRIKESILSEGRYVTQEEINFRIQKEASFLENEYNLNLGGLT